MKKYPIFNSVRDAAKVCLAWGIALLCLCAKAQNPNLQIDLPYFGANPATNRYVTYQQTTPFLGNLVGAYSDSVTGMVIFPSVPSGVLNIVITAPPGSKIPFNVNILPNDSGTVNATNRLSNSGPTYPAGSTSWSIATSDQRYALSTNQAQYYVPQNTFTNATNVLQNAINMAPGTPLLAGSNVITYLSGGSNVINGTVSQLAVTLAQSNAAAISTNMVNSSSNVLQANIIGTNTLNLTTTTNLSIVLSNNLVAYIGGTSNNSAAVLVYATGVSNNALAAQNIALAVSNLVITTSNSIAGTNLISISSSNYANLVIVTNLVVLESNNVTANQVISNTANLVITTNLVAFSSNNVTASYLALVSLASNTVAANSLSQLQGANVSLLAYILTNNPTFAGAANSNFQNLVITTNLVISLSNNLVPYTSGTSNSVNAVFLFAQTVSNSVVTASNTVAANAQSALVATNSALAAAIAATNAQIIPVINIASNANAGYSLSISNQSASVLLHSITVSNALVTGTNILAAYVNSQIGLSNAASAPALAALSNGVVSQITAGTNSGLAALGGTNTLILNQVTNLVSAATNTLAAPALVGNVPAGGFGNIAAGYGNLIGDVVSTIHTQFVYSNNYNGAFAGNLAGSSNLPGSSIVGQIPISVETNMQNFALTASTNFVTPSTNIIGVAYGGSLSVNGTYLGAASTPWTNVANPNLQILLAGGLFYLQSNLVTMYSWPSIPGTVTAVNGIAPVPNVFFGRYHNYAGEIGTNSVSGSLSVTNLAWGTNATYSLSAQPMQEYLPFSNGVALPYLIITLITNHP